MKDIQKYPLKSKNFKNGIKVEKMEWFSLGGENKIFWVK